MLKDYVAGVCLAVCWPDNYERFKSLDSFVTELISAFNRCENMQQVESEVLTLLDVWPSRYLKIDWTAFRRDLNLVYRVWHMSK